MILISDYKKEPKYNVLISKKKSKYDLIADYKKNVR